MCLKSALAAILCSSVLLGATAASAAQTELKLWAWDDNFNIPAAKMAAERFQAKHPDVTISVESMAQNDLTQRLNTALAAKNYRTLPDVMLIEDYRVQNFLTGYPDFLKDIGSQIDLTKFVDHKVAASSDASGKHYGVPFDAGVVATYLRIDLFEKAGYTLDDFKDITWDQFIEMGKKVKETTGTALLGYDPDDMHLIQAMMQSAGVWYTNADATKVTIADNAAIKEAFTVLKKMHDAGLIVNYSGWTPMLATFQQDQVAAVVQGCWLTPSLASNEAQSGKWRVIPLPKLNNVPKATHYSNLGGSQWFANALSDKSDLAVQFIKETFATDEDLINQLVPKITLVTTLKDTSKITNNNVENPFFGGQKIYATFADWNTKIPSVNYGPHTRAIASIISEGLQRVIAGEDIDTVLQDCQSNAEMQVGLM